jgi:hypothetical protein
MRLGIILTLCCIMPTTAYIVSLFRFIFLETFADFFLRRANTTRQHWKGLYALEKARSLGLPLPCMYEYAV